MEKKPSWRIRNVLLLPLLLLVWSLNACPTGVPTYEYSVNQFTYSSSFCAIYDEKVGPLSGDIYRLIYSIEGGNYRARISRSTTDGNVIWERYYSAVPIESTLAISSDETKLIFIKVSLSELYIVMANTLDGDGIIHRHSTSFVSGLNEIRALSTPNKYLISVVDAGNDGYLCELLPSVSLNCVSLQSPAQSISLIADDNAFYTYFYFGKLCFEALSFSSSSYLWKLYYDYGGSSSSGGSKSAYIEDKNIIAISYVMDSQGSFLLLNEDGSVASIHTSDSSLDLVRGISYYESSIFSVFELGSASKLVSLSTKTSQVTVFDLVDSPTIYALAVYPSHLALVGKTSECYSITLNSYLTMNPRVSVSSETFTETTISLAASSFLGMTSYPYSAGDFITSGSILGTSPTSVNIKLDLSYSFEPSEEIYNEREAITINLDESLLCDATGKLSIYYQLIGAAPAWVSLDSATKQMHLDAPEVDKDESFQFFIQSCIVGGECYDQQFNITVLNVECEAQHCQQCVVGETQVCEICIDGYALSEDSGLCQEDPSNEVEQAVSATVYASQATLGVAVIASIGLTLLANSSPQSMWLMVNQYQLFLLLPMIGAYIPKNVKDYLIGMEFTLFSFDFIPVKESPGFSHMLNKLDYEQESSYLEEIGIESGSAIVNHFSLFTTAITFALVHLAMLFAKSLMKKMDDSKLAKMFVVKVVEAFTYGVYIRLYLEAYQFIAMSSCSEVGHPQTSNAYFSASLAIACLFLFLLVGSLPFMYAKSRSNKEYLHHLLNYGRRLILVALVTLPQMPLIAKLALFCVCQLIYLILICVFRPLEKAKETIIDITNEVIFSILSSLLIYFKSEGAWNIAIEYIYIGIILSNSVLITGIIGGAFISHLIRNGCKSPINNKVENEPSPIEARETQNISAISDNRILHQSQTTINKYGDNEVELDQMRFMKMKAQLYKRGPKPNEIQANPQFDMDRRDPNYPYKYS